MKFTSQNRMKHKSGIPKKKIQTQIIFQLKTVCSISNTTIFTYRMTLFIKILTTIIVTNYVVLNSKKIKFETIPFRDNLSGISPKSASGFQPNLSDFPK